METDTEPEAEPAPVTEPGPAPVGRTAPFSRRAVAPVGVTPPPRTGSGDLASAPPMAAFAGARPASFSTSPSAATAPSPPSSAVAALDAVAEHATQVEAAQAAEQQRIAALEARRTQAAERPSWFMSAPPQAPVSTSPFALVSSRPDSSPLQPAGPTAEEIAAEKAERAQLQAFHDQAGATVVHPDELRGALTASASPPAPVVPPIVETPATFTQPPPPAYEPAPEAAVPAAAAAAPDQGQGQDQLTINPPEAVDDRPAKVRKSRLRRGARTAVAPPANDPAAEAAATSAAALTQDAAMEAYRRYAREGTMVAEDYYRGQVEEIEAVPEPTIVIAESLIPTGKPRLAKQPDKPRGPKIMVALVVLAIAGGGYYYETHQVRTPVVTGLPSVTLDETTAAADGTFTVPAASTSGASYHLSVPAGWKAISSPTRPGGAHTDVTVTEPILNLSVTVKSDSESSPDTVVGKTVDTALRVFGHPAGIVAPAEPAGSSTVSRVATVTQNGVRYSVTLTVPRESAVRDYARAAVVARSLTQ